jgi:hypothetical protein
MLQFSTTAILLQADDTAATAAAGAFATGFMLIWLAVVVVMLAAMWKVFEKAGEPGWAAIVPIYNIIVLLKIAGKPAWWVVLMFVPFVNIVVAFLAAQGVANRFGKGTGFAIGLLVLAPVFYAMLAWGDARYSGSMSGQAAMA